MIVSNRKIKKQKRKKVIERLNCSIKNSRFPFVSKQCVVTQKKQTVELLDLILSSLFPGYLGAVSTTNLTNCEDSLQKILSLIHHGLETQLKKIISFETGFQIKNEKDILEAVEHFIHTLPDIREHLLTDIEAIYEGDPAAHSFNEIIIAYPGLIAIAIHRISHELYKIGVPILPRIMSEHAHQITGVDIHPGAVIGKYFFIDHGTGVVIGETTIIGNNVKIYQGVTLGALSFPKDLESRVIKGIKRHPNIGDFVIIYAGATVLGGDTFIGENTVIGGNCWITSSIPSDTMVNFSVNQIKKTSSKI